MGNVFIAFDSITFGYDSSSGPILDKLTLRFPVGWTGVVGANGAGKTTVLKLAASELKPLSGFVRTQGSAIYCPQRTDEPPGMFDALSGAMDAEACEIKGRLGLQPEWPARWETLSHGERKRAQIAVALWRRPDALAVDEPTNHLDADARRMLRNALRAFDGVGLLVSHDRELLDSLCRRCLFIDPPHAVMRPGGYSKGDRQAEMDEAAARREFDLARRERRRLEREAQKRREEATQMLKKRSKRGLAIKDHDARFKKNRARLTGRDGVGGRAKRQIEGRVEQARQHEEGIQVKKSHDLGIWLPGSRSKRDALFQIRAGSLPLGALRQLDYPDLMMRSNDRVALTGPNGAGKSTLVRLIARSLNLPEERVTYVPQEIPLEASKDIMNKARRLPGNRLGRMMSVVSRLNSRPERLLESDEPSPGEIRKILLAIGIAQAPHLIVMDEPTNHLDLPSIECLENALTDCPCGLLLVSHDERFLGRLVEKRWHIEPVKDAQGKFALEERC